MLQQAARRVEGTLRTGDTVGRLGGDEFAVTLSGFASVDDAGVVTQKLTHALEQPLCIDRFSQSVSAFRHWLPVVFHVYPPSWCAASRSG